MVARLLVVFVLLSAAQALENPCKDKQKTGCGDQITSCPVVFPKEGTAETGFSPNQKCFNPKDPDYALTPLCMDTCETCCLDPMYDCDDDPIPTIDCPNTPDLCNQFGDINFAHCQSSCGWCGLESKPCFDALPATAIPNCDKYKAADLCTDPEVSTQCELTCGVCFSTECVDNSKRCPVWIKNGFCDDAFYAADKASYCKKSCNLCQ